MIDIPPEYLLGRHVIGRTAHECGCSAHFFEHLREAEIHDLHDPLGRDEEVGRLDISVNDALPMGVIESAAGLASNPQNIRRRELTPLTKNRLEGLAFE